MAAARSSTSRSRFAILGVLAFGPSTGYEIRKLLTETTAHFWKESYGQIYPTLEKLSQEGMVEVVSHETSGRETKRYRILPRGEQALKEWIRSPKIQLKPGRNELLLKLFFARREDIPWLLSQLETYASIVRSMLATYNAFKAEPESEEIPPDSRVLIGTTIDYGISAAHMQLDWCERTSQELRTLAQSS
jgi:DNA-binding PadR family transcriptional regulator